MGITKDLAHYIVGARFEDLPPNVVRLTKQLVLDEIGCAFGGLAIDEARQVVDMAKDFGGKPESTIVGNGTRVPCVNGASVNAYLAYVLDFDETYRNRTHPASMLVCSAIGMAERQGASGKDTINSIVTAYDIVTRISDATCPSLEMRKKAQNYGFPVFGSMAAAAMILGLNEGQVCDAIGIAGYTAPIINLNLWLTESPISPIKGGVYWRCKRGIEAALLAQRGFMGPPDILDKKDWGWWAGVSDRCDWDAFTYKLGEEYYLEKYLAFKPWSCCRWHHPGIGLLLQLLKEEKIDPADIEEIVYKIHGDLIGFAPFHVAMPEDPFGAMFSIPWSFSTMALGYQPGPDWFARERQDDPRVRELAKKIMVEEDPEVTRLHDEDPEKSFAKLIVKVKGKIYERQTEYAKGDHQNPMTQEELEEKFSSMAKRVVSDKQAKRIIDIVNHLEELGDLRELTREFAEEA